MDTCDACGRKSENLTFVESVEMDVCPSCLRIAFAPDKNGVIRPVYDLEIGSK